MSNAADVNLYANYYIMAPVGAWRALSTAEGVLYQSSSILDREAPAE